jgi:hypothetical protein
VFALTNLLSPRAPAVLGAVLFAAITTVSNAAADGCGNGLSPDRTVDGKVGAWSVEIVGIHDCRGVARVSVQASQSIPGDIALGGRVETPLSGGGVLVVPIFCRRDDYMLLPAAALGGLPCVGVPATDRFDPLALAERMEAALPPPDLRIGMNPARGMVAVPTWFWVEGYDGGLLSQSETVLETHERCQFFVTRDARGMPVLGEDGRPTVRRSCTVETTTFVVDVRLWPSRFVWDFGDGHGSNLVCQGKGDCGGALGQPFIDSAHPSPVQHPYRWSSLGANGAQDAYTINLDVTFGAEFRVTTNGRGAGWQNLDERVLNWTANHQVQEAQAVLTRP